MLLLLTVKMITAKNHAVLVAILFLFVVIVIYESEKWIKIGMPPITLARLACLCLMNLIMLFIS